ncbi:ionotropic receptor 75a-like [Chrysoperla carnea]|uniref:ionotropic receptor 75a-like n=1 Tax=Chrysoperla carnea TaxID=189513 RepID=UPI001D085AE6|nr:ionotropic receptor 75a-like [Chrysoperla carnea]
MNRLELRTGAVVLAKIKIPYYDWLINDDEKIRGMDALTKYHIPLTLNIADFYNLRFKFIRHPTWGYLHPDSGWDGVIRSLINNQLDFGASAVFMRKDRASVTKYTNVGFWRQEFVYLDYFTYAIKSFRVSNNNAFLFRHPKMTRGVRNVFLRPLTDEVWEAAVVYCVILLILLKIALYSDWKLLYSKIFDISNTYDNKNWSSCIMIILGSITQQGAITSPSNLIAGRFMTFNILTFSLVFYQFYSASIVSSLLQMPPKTLRTLKQLLDSNLQLAIENAPYTIDWLTVIPRIWPVREGVEKIQKGGKAFHVTLNNAYKLIRETWSEREICELQAIKLRDTKTVFTILHKQSNYRNIFNIAIIRQFEHGIMNCHIRRWQFKKPDCLLSLSSAVFHVSFQDIYFALIILVLGWIFSLISLIIEQFLKKEAKSLFKKRIFIE